MGMDIYFATLHCYNTARKYFMLPKSFSPQKAERRISHFGKKCIPCSLAPRLKLLQYKSCFPLTVYSCGIEKIIAVYHVDFLDKYQYSLIFSSASANSNTLKGKKKHILLDKSQKRSPINQVSIIIIFAKQVDEELRDRLFNVVQQQSGDSYDNSWLPCVVDLEKQICTFNSLRNPYFGFQYPVKNRGIRLIRKYLFNYKLPFSSSPEMLDPIKDYNPDESLWSFWKTMKKELHNGNSKKYFEKMKHGDIILEDGYLYLKWKDRGIWVSVEINDELQTAEVDVIDSWYYPKSNKIAKDTIREIKDLINAYFAAQGYTAKYLSSEYTASKKVR